MTMERLDKNFLWLSAANIIGSFFNIIIFIYLARVLGAESFGYLSYATTIVLYLFNFVDLGLSTYGTREVAKDRSRLSELVSNILSFKFALAFVLFFVFAAIVSLTSQPLLIKVLLCEVALTLFTASLAAEWAFQGLEKMHMIFVSLAATSFLQLCLNLAFVRGPQDLLNAPIVSFIAPIPVIALFLIMLSFRPRVRRMETASIKKYLSSALAIWAISAFVQIYNNMDIVMLGFFRSPEEVGYFTVARRVIGGAGLVMMVLAGAAMPHLSASFIRDKAKFRSATSKFLKLSLFAIIILFVPVMIFAKKIISMTVGAQYLPAAEPVQLMMVAVIFIMFNLPFSTGLIAAGFERDVLKQAAASAALSIFSNFILTPKYGMIGASISFILAEGLALSWILCLYNIKIRKGGV